jgi:hypothetical protein
LATKGTTEGTTKGTNSGTTKGNTKWIKCSGTKSATNSRHESDTWKGTARG